MTAAAASAHEQLTQARWALLFGNFAIGCGVMVTAGSLNSIVRSLDVSVALGGQLITLAAVVMCFGAPLAAAFIGGWDRRRLLVLSLVWYAFWHALSALAPNYATLLPLRSISVLGAAIFTPQAAAAISVVAPPEERGRSIVFIFLGWSVASVLGMPVHSFIGETFGWRWAFALVTVLSAGGAWWVWRVMPDGVKPPAMRLSDWREVFTHPVLMAIVLVTALTGAAQFTVFAYFAPYYREVLNANALETSFLFFWFGAFALIGNLLMSRYVDRVGAARIVGWSLIGMAIGIALFPVAGTVATMAAVTLPWAIGGFASNSAQQARLGSAAPALSSALMALNSSAIYLGQAVGAAGGGAIVAAHVAAGHTGKSMYGGLAWVALGWALLGLGLSHWAQRRMERDGGRA